MRLKSLPHTFGTRCRKQRKFTQGEIEKRTGLFRCYVSRVEKGQAVPAGEFKRRVVRRFKAEVPPRPSRPRTELVTRPAEMRRQGKTWQQVYAECLPHVIGTSDSRQLAQYRLRCEVRSRRKPR
jgi:transcriptional regulator with XRE-family HTH domain